MAADVSSLFAEAHGKCFRILSDVLNIDCQGLACVARVSSRRHVIDGERCTKLARLDTAFAVARRMNTAKSKTFIEYLASMVEASLLGKVDSGSGLGQEGVAATIVRGGSRSSGSCCGDEAVEATAASREPIAEDSTWGKTRRRGIGLRR